MKTKIFFCLILTALTAFSVSAEGLSDYDRQIVASCMVLEAGCDGVEGMQAVLNVVLNRADGYLHRLVPETIKYGAFSCMAPIWSTTAPNYSPLIQRAQNQDHAYATALYIIAVMETGELWDNTYGATHYHASSVRPYWLIDMSYITTVGSHHFYIQTRELQRYASL